MVLAILALLSGEWVYRSYVRPVDPPTPLMLSLARHFNSVGIKGHLYAVRHGYRHSEMTAAAAFQIDGYPLPVLVEQCTGELLAEEHLHAVQRAPNLMNARRNGLLVMNLPMWGDGTGSMATRVTDAFVSFNGALPPAGQSLRSRQQTQQPQA